jgi:hypothetical protein
MESLWTYLTDVYAMPHYIAIYHLFSGIFRVRRISCQVEIRVFPSTCVDMKRTQRRVEVAKAPRLANPFLGMTSLRVSPYHKLDLTHVKAHEYLLLHRSHLPLAGPNPALPDPARPRRPSDCSDSLPRCFAAAAITITAGLHCPSDFRPAAPPTATGPGQHTRDFLPRAHSGANSHVSRRVGFELLKAGCLRTLITAHPKVWRLASEMARFVTGENIADKSISNKVCILKRSMAFCTVATSHKVTFFSKEWGNGFHENSKCSGTVANCESEHRSCAS